MAFVDQGEFEAIKTLSGWEAARCDEHPFRAKIKVSASFLPSFASWVDSACLLLLATWASASLFLLASAS